MAIGQDFCTVQLTQDGEAFAKGPIHIANGRWSFRFLPGTPQRVAKYEWDLFLAGQVSPTGVPLFELAPVTTAAAVPAAEPNLHPEAPQETK